MKSLFIDKLFGLYTYRLDFDNEEGLTILTGPNGYGKTTILNIINCLHTKNFYYFSTLEFNIIVFNFENGCEIRITKDKNDLGKFDIQSFEQSDVDFELRLNNNLISVLHFNVSDFLKEIKNLGYSEVREGGWTSRYDTYYSSTAEVVEKEQDVLEKFLSNSNSEEFLLFLNSLNTCCFIKEKRLLIPSLLNPYQNRYRTKHNRGTSAIRQLSEELREEINKTRLESMKLAQELESSFPKRLLESEDSPDDNAYKEKLEKLKDKLSQLKQYGLSDMYISDMEYNDKNKQILTVYLSDTEKKASYFDGVLSKINLFVEIISKKQFASKEIYINAEKGFGFKFFDGKELALDLLSSGEQHELVMNYYLLFHTQAGTLVLIDEPEISLHVAWQHECIADLMKIASIKKIKLVVATHSPQIIGSKWDLCKDLYEIANKSIEA